MDSSTCSAHRRAVCNWLARTHPLPEQAHAEWAHHGLALLPLGRRFDAIRIPAGRMRGVVGSAEPDTVAKVLAEWLHGPVLRDTRYSEAPYYALVPPGTPWPDTEQHLGADAYLGVPRPDGVTPLAAWVVPPQHPGHLCDPARLRTLLATADSPTAAET
ncbi:MULTISPECIES: hypothetical protein [Streptomyces]|uniref:Uncharacterized protein n=1 Tax=Streptomyces alboflavus TaxID=67267 RepID=A0A1Z1W9Y7_9ACTN|nr:hypothetical protein [Streptomyces alboflavus]ARX83190.1 hypothetical protein SMD44_02604 [Streptomyces alboflavus]